MRESPCLSVSFSQWKSARHRFCLPYICPDGESRGLGHHAPIPHTSSMSSMPAMLKFASTFVPRLVKKAKETNFPVGPVWNIMLYFDCITCGDLSGHWGQIPRFTVCLLAAAFLCKLWSCWFESMSYSCGLLWLLIYKDNRAFLLFTFLFFLIFLTPLYATYRCLISWLLDTHSLIIQ